MLNGLKNHPNMSLKFVPKVTEMAEKINTVHF
jgi:hypothetical protein